MCNTISLPLPSLVYSPDVYTNELSSVEFKKNYYLYTLITISKVYNQLNLYCWISLRAFPFSCYTLLHIITVLLDTTQTTPGPSQNMDYITKGAELPLAMNALYQG